MSLLQRKSIIFTLLAVTSCGYNPYGPVLLTESTKKCDRLIESTARENCYKDVNENYNSLQELKDKKKREDNEKLDFKRKKEPILNSEN